MAADCLINYFEGFMAVDCSINCYYDGGPSTTSVLLLTGSGVDADAYNS